MYPFTPEEKDKVLSGYFVSQTPLVLRELPPKPKRKYIALSIISDAIPDGTFSEKELNLILKDFHDDYVTLRRSLIDFSLMERTRDGSSYWKTKKKT